jgi:hypothetical protein
MGANLNRCLLVLCATLAACATSQLKSSWRDPGFAGPPATQVLVVGVAKADAHRRIFEDTFASALATAGTRAQASHPTVPGGDALTRASLVAALGAGKADAVLVTRAVRATHYARVTPPAPYVGSYAGGMQGWYGSAWTAAPVIDTYEVLTLETTLWDAKSEKPVWSGTTDTVAGRSLAELTEGHARALIARMKADGVLR